MSSASGDEPPWKRVKRSNYHRRRYGAVVEQPLDMTVDANPWRFDANRRDVWLAVWAHCSFAELLACSRVCRRWRAELLESGANVDVWGIGGIDGSWLVACLPLLVTHWPCFTKEQQWQQSEWRASRYLLPSKVVKSLSNTPTLEAVVRATMNQWQTPSTLRVGYQRQQETVEKRRQRTERQRLIRVRLASTLDCTLLGIVGNNNVDSRVRRVLRGVDAFGPSVLPNTLKAIIDDLHYEDNYKPAWFGRVRERYVFELVRRHVRNSPSWPLSEECLNMSTFDVYRALVDWTFARFDGGAHAATDMVAKFARTDLIDDDTRDSETR